MRIDDIFPYDPKKYFHDLEKLYTEKLVSGRGELDKLDPSIPILTSIFKTMSEAEKTST